MSFKKQLLTADLISTITQQQQTQKVYKLNATSMNISKIEPSIKKYNKLRCAILDFNYINKIQNLNALFDLRQLHLNGNLISKIQGLQTCKNLTVLNLSSNQIQKIQKISHLTKLQTLNLSKNKIEKITNLQSLKQLKTLNLSFNNINLLQSLPSFSKLQILLLNNNLIQKISPNALVNSTKISKIDLSFNKMRQCTFISKFPNIETINLSNNQLQRFQTEQPLKYLEELNLEKNNIDRIQPIGQYFPELVILNINDNLFCSEHQFITALSDSSMLTEIQFVNNPIYSTSFQNTLFQLYKFDRINKKPMNTPGTKYMESIACIQQSLKNQLTNVQDDEDDRKIKMSGFYNDDLQNRMTGIKPHRAISPATKKAKAIINQNLNDIQKNFTEFVQNDKRIKSLRQIYQRICQQNNIAKPEIQAFNESQEEIYLTCQKNQQTTKYSSPTQETINQLRLRNDNNLKVMNDSKRQKQTKWAQLKARTKQRSFNIRKSRTKQMNDSLSKLGTQIPSSKKISSELMKTQLNPMRPLNSVVLQSAGKTGNTFYRPLSQKKLPFNK